MQSTVDGDAASIAKPLGSEDLAILALESETIAGHSCSVIMVEGGLRRGALLDRLAERIDRTPLLTCRLEERPEGYFWASDPHFDLENHLSAPPMERPCDRPGLCDAVAQLFEQHLDRTQPLWSIALFALDGGGSASCGVFTTPWPMAPPQLCSLNACCGTGAENTVTTASLHTKQDVADDARRRKHLAALLGREFGRQHGASPFDGTVGTKREIALADVSLSRLRQAARAVDGATVNDAILAVVAGALRHWIEHQHGRLADVRVRVACQPSRRS